jgi:thioredoxin-related protein
MKLSRLFALPIVLLLLSVSLSAQEKVQVYDTELDGMEQIKEAVKVAQAENKHILVQVGGNWCPWCIRFHKYSHEEADIKKIIDNNYVVVKLNYSPENKNEAALKKLGNPGRFGYPVFVVLDAKGNRLHTQDSGLLEEDKGYSKKKVRGFLMGWMPGSF